jgi:hypothetical protein
MFSLLAWEEDEEEAAKGVFDCLSLGVASLNTKAGILCLCLFSILNLNLTSTIE